MQDRVSLVRYFADMRKLVTMCYKLALEKEELQNRLNNPTHLFSNQQKKRPNTLDKSSSSDSSSSSNDIIIQSSQPKAAKKADKVQSKTRSGTVRKNPKSKQASQVWPCNQCDKQYFHYTSLKRHIATDHPQKPDQEVQKHQVE